MVLPSLKLGLTTGGAVVQHVLLTLDVTNGIGILQHIRMIHHTEEYVHSSLTMLYLLHGIMECSLVFKTATQVRYKNPSEYC